MTNIQRTILKQYPNLRPITPPKVRNIHSEDEIRRLYRDENKSVAEIAELLKFKPRYITYLLTKYKITRIPKEKLDVKLIEELYKVKKNTLKECSKILGVHISTVRKYLVQHKLYRTSKKKPFLKDDYNNIIVRFIRGKNITSLAKEYNCSRNAIYKILIKHKIISKKPIKNVQPEESQSN